MVLKGRLSSRWNSTLLVEYFRPGRYDASSRQHTAIFLRTEPVCRF
ncbi:MAG TPA: hypothetical protein VG734_13010 [Lacunisphaera sp.]|nr:hypothetical protein [Lacunisphaera sp.]